MTKLTIEDIKSRIESAVYVMRLLPPVKAQDYRSTMPDIIYTPQEIMLMDRKPIKPKPTSEQITQMDEVLVWLEVLEPWERKLVWKRGARIPWKVLSYEFGLHRSNLCRHYERALVKILVKVF
ncbi:MAG: helix-turn-helix domain-containing protein [Alphaproteobacteria bacterium]|nr:helix-turn-helix domain-containing protein [Alphaproteobacteria bacterium]